MRVFWWIAAVFALVACSSKASIFEKTMELTSHWDSGIRGNNSAGLSGIYNDTLYIWGENSNSYLMNFYKPDGTLVKTITLPKGKGPGQIVFAYNGGIFNDTISIFDSGFNRITHYDIDGKYLDETTLDDKIAGTLPRFIIVDDKIYLHGTFDVFLAIIDKKSGTVLKKIDYKVKPDLSKNEIPVSGGYLTYDRFSKQLLLGYYSSPCTIERYDLDLNKIKATTFAFKDSYEPLRWSKFSDGSGMTQIGHYIIGSIAYDQSYLYIRSPFGFKKTNDGNEALPSNNFVNVFDRETHAHVGVVKDPTLNGTGSYQILGIINNQIFAVWDGDIALLENKLGQKIVPLGEYILVYTIK